MPTYEYRCPKGHAFEVFQKMSDEPVTTCPECGQAAERVVSGGAGFLFKGEGFYITDSRSAEYKKKAEADQGTSGGKPAEGGSTEGGKKPEEKKKEKEKKDASGPGKGSSSGEE